MRIDSFKKYIWNRERNIMKKFLVLYVLLLLATILLGAVYVVSIITVRYIAVAVMGIVCIREKFSFPKNVNILLYSVFVNIFALTSLGHGYFVDFFKLFLGFYFTTYIWIWATHILINKYDKIDVLIYTMIGMCVVNALVTIGQHFMNPISFLIPKYLNIQGIDLADNIIAKSDSTITQFCLYGIFGLVPNGYYSAVGTVMSLYLYSQKNKLIYIVLWIICLYGLFCVQERAGLVAGAFFSLYYFAKTINTSLSRIKKQLLIIGTIILVAWVSSNISFSNLIEGSRYESFDLDTRIDLYSTSVDYIMNNLFTANMFDFYYTTGMWPHNLLYNCFIYGTLFGAILMLIVQFRFCRIASICCLRSIDEYNRVDFLFSCATLCYMVVSLTHNASILSGDILFWIVALPLIRKELR